MSGAALELGVLRGLAVFAANDPERPAVMSGGTSISYAALWRDARRLASALREDGVHPGDRVALLLDNSPDLVLAYLGALACGAVAVPYNPKAPAAALARVFQDCRPLAAFLKPSAVSAAETLCEVVPGFTRAYAAGPLPAGATFKLAATSIADRLAATPSAAELPLPSEQDLALIAYTSGTTGPPKGVMLSHANMMEVAAAGRRLLEVRSRERIGAVVPLFHLYGLRELDLAFSSGATIVVPAERHFAAAILAELKQAGVTGLSSVPSAIAILLERHQRELADCLGGLRYLTIGTAPLPSRTLALLRETLPNTRLITTYGLTEASRVCWNDVTDPAIPWDPRIVGKPYPGVTLQLVDESGGIGRVAVISKLVMRGYWANDTATASVMAPGGALLTPDCGRIDAADGKLHLLGRVDDVINCGGQKVSPVEIEEVLASHPSIDSVTVLRIPDPEGILGEVAQAVVIPRAGASLAASDVQAYAASRLEPHKVPRYVEFVREIPRSVLGKPSRAELSSGQTSPRGELQPAESVGQVE